MDKTIIKKRFKKTVRLTVCVGIFLLALGIFLAVFLVYTLNKVAKDQIKAETVEYISRFDKQIATNFKMLDTFSSVITNSGIEGEENFAQVLTDVSERNAFITIAYFNSSKEGTIVTQGKQARLYLPLSSLQDEIQTVVYDALEEKRSISDLFVSEFSGKTVFVYGVPVYKNGEVAGALVASDHIEIFTDILDGNGVLGGNGYLHMIDSDGRFLIRSHCAVVKEKVSSIFDGPYLERCAPEAVRRALQNGEEVSFSFPYQGETYQSLLEPVGTNGWYLFCVNTVQASSHFIYTLVLVIAASFFGVLALSIFLLYYDYRSVQKSNQELIRLAYYDDLTGAYNLFYFCQKIGKRLAKPQSCSIVAFNLFQFKFINEIFGRDQADKLLCDISKTISQHLKEGEFYCRDTADSFYIFLRDTRQDAVCTRLNTLFDEITNSTSLDSDFRVSAYCGVITAGERGKKAYDVDQLMTLVMFALSKAKEKRRSRICFYDASLHETMKLENYLEGRMQYALETREFHMFLQPKINLKTNSLGGAEALVRWVEDNGVVICPDQFIPLFEKNGFCVQLDQYMVECACQKIREWIDKGIEPIGIAVNQSKSTFYESDHIDALCRLVEKYQIPPKLITLEILEGLAMENIKELNRKIEQLQKTGFQISMDDFGSGYSSLNTLAKLKINELKLDKGFLREASLEGNQRSKIIMKQIVQLADCLSISTVVEGVETKKEESFIRSLGCNYGQGYYYSRPVSSKEFDIRYMEDRRSY